MVQQLRPISPSYTAINQDARNDAFLGFSWGTMSFASFAVAAAQNRRCFMGSSFASSTIAGYEVTKDRGSLIILVVL